MKLMGKHATCAAAAVLAIGAWLPAQAEESLPGEGKTLRFARSDSLGANYVQDVILIEGLKKLGYKVQMSTLGSTAPCWRHRRAIWISYLISTCRSRKPPTSR
ncbi:hypothetical protein [Pseudaminobacter salicylatoxidans]|uniref:hypothetical protein n=1 Tax=Pseudaminobacter salicylatoxidans TaxID=93369 RepID=UPI0018E09BB2|nr:hypothetical protein [Pseudaminobacter salicylatoxidans]